jgi:hypothetical protein
MPRMLRTLVLCLLLPACLDEEPPDVPDHEVIFTVKAPSSFDTLTMVLPESRESVTVDPPSSVYLWDYATYFLPDNLQMIAYRDGVAVAHAAETLTYDQYRDPDMFTIELVP